MEFTEHATFRVTRDADYDISEAAEDLLEAVEQELRRRRFGDVVRLEVEATMSDEMRAADHGSPARATRDHVYRAPPAARPGRPLPARIRRPARPALPAVDAADAAAPARRLARASTCSPRSASGDILVHHPYDAFDTSVERFIEQAVDDPDVLAIKHTIYRTAATRRSCRRWCARPSRASRRWRWSRCTARFDEERNIRWARSLERAGVHVVYGLAGLKTHAKLALVVRREGDACAATSTSAPATTTRRTARLYTDLGLFTCREDSPPTCPTCSTT